MSGWTHHRGRAAALDLENVDTDQIIPARLMSTPRSQGYGGLLFHDLRRGEEAQDLFAHLKGASVLIAGQNFGCGSSREAAVYALLDFGFRAIIAPSFGDIFASNAVNNGVLPAVVDAGLVADLISDLDDQAELAEVDLSTSRLTVCGREIPFDLDPVWREKLINGWDDIDLTHQHAEAIRTYRAKRAEAHPWIFAAAPGAK